MALSALEQAYMDYTMTYGGGGTNTYWGTTLTGGYGSIAGSGPKGSKGVASNDHNAAHPKPPSGENHPPVKLPFDPHDYQHEDHGNPAGLQPYWQYYNGTYIFKGHEVPCDGWTVYGNGDIVELPACPHRAPLVAHNDWAWLP